VETADMMILRNSPSSPFVRKVKIVAELLGLDKDIKLLDTATATPDGAFLQDNPLGKIPALTPDGGEPIFDSRVIVEYLDLRAGGGKVIPAELKQRIAALTLQALADGITDAALLLVYEGRYRPADKAVQAWIDLQTGKVQRGLARLESTLTLPEGPVHVGHIAVACALGYQDLRFEGRWRKDYPKLVAWLAAFEAKVPAFANPRLNAA
jgi:glutathione S-transferase